MAALKVRTTKSASVSPGEAMQMLRAGNQRFVKGTPQATTTSNGQRLELVDDGQAPHTVTRCSCLDSVCCQLFDAQTFAFMQNTW